MWGVPGVKVHGVLSWGRKKGYVIGPGVGGQADSTPRSLQGCLVEGRLYGE